MIALAVAGVAVTYLAVGVGLVAAILRSRKWSGTADAAPLGAAAVGWPLLVAAIAVGAVLRAVGEAAVWLAGHR